MKSIVAILVVLLMSSVAFAQGGNFTGKYETKQCKKDGDTCGEITFLETMVKKKDGTTMPGAGFTIHSESIVNAKRGDVRVREIGDESEPKFAEKVDATRFLYTDEDGCTVVFDFSKMGTVTVKSKECDGYFDNTYRKTK